MYRVMVSAVSTSRKIRLQLLPPTPPIAAAAEDDEDDEDEEDISAAEAVTSSTEFVLPSAAVPTFLLLLPMPCAPMLFPSRSLG